MSYRLEIGLALLLAGGIGVAVWAAQRTPKPPAPDRRASTFLSGPRGSRALYDVLVRLGRPVERRRTALFTLAEDTVRRPALLVVLNPPIHLQAAELEQVVRFVRSGGNVLAAGRGGGITGCTGWDAEPPGQGFGVDSLPVRGREEGGGLRLPPVARVLEWRPAERGLERLVKRRPTRAEDDPCGPLIARGTDTLLATADGRPVVLRLHYGNGGTITLAADAGWFTNHVWRDTDVPVAILPLLTPPPLPPPPPTRTPTPRRRMRVAWDEYHQGFGRQGPSVEALTWDWLRHSPVGWTILQLVAVGLIWLAATAVRFGPARPVIERRRRSPLEHLEALAAGLESASAADTAVERMISGLRRRLRRAGTPAPDAAHLASWLDGLELAVSGTRGRAAVRRLRHLITQRGGDERVLAAAQAVEDVWEELRPRTTRDAS
jgi:hypothetical protein